MSLSRSNSQSNKGRTAFGISIQNIDQNDGASSTGSGSIAALLKDSASIAKRLGAPDEASAMSKRLETIEQQMLTLHLRVAGAPEAAEVTAQNVVTPFSDEIHALKARTEMAEQQLRECARANQMERLCERITEAEGRINALPGVMGKSMMKTESSDAFARLELTVSLLSRQLAEGGTKTQELERTLMQNRSDAHKIEQCVNESVATKLQDAHRRQTSEAAAMNTRLEALEQQVTLMKCDVVDVTRREQAVAENSVAAFSNEVSALRSRLEMTEQQLLACAESSQLKRLSERMAQTEVHAQNQLAPFSDEIAVLKARVETAHQQIMTCAQSSHMDRLSERLTEAEVRLKAIPNEFVKRAVMEDQTQTVSRVELSVNLLSRQIQETGSKMQELEKDRIGSLAERTSAIEASYRDIGGALLRQSEAIGPLIANEIAGLVARLDAQETMIKANAAQNIAPSTDAQDRQMEKEKVLEAMRERVTYVEEKLQACAPLPGQMLTLTERLAMAEKQLASAPNGTDFKLLHAAVDSVDTQSLLERLTALETQLASTPNDTDIKMLHAALEAVEAQCMKVAQEVTVTSRSVAGGGGSVAEVGEQSSDASLSQQIDEMRKETNRLAEGLSEERRERYKAVADVNRMSEVVSKAASATIERAEKRFAEELGAERALLKQQLASATQAAMSFTSVGQDGIDRRDAAIASNASEPVSANMLSLLKPSKALNLGIGSDLARCVGEMDAELRVELTRCLEALQKDFDTTRRCLASRIDTVEKRILTIEEQAICKADNGTEPKDVGDQLSASISLASVASTVTEKPRLVTNSSSTSFPQNSNGIETPSRPNTITCSSRSFEAINLTSEHKPVTAANSSSGASSVTVPAPRRSPEISLRDAQLSNTGDSVSCQLWADEISKNRPSGGPLLTEMIQQAMKQIVPEPSSRTTPNRSPSPSLSNPQAGLGVSADLKANLKNLVTAVNKTLGDRQSLGSCARDPSADNRSQSISRTRSPGSRSNGGSVLAAAQGQGPPSNVPWSPYDMQGRSLPQSPPGMNRKVSPDMSEARDLSTTRDRYPARGGGFSPMRTGSTGLANRSGSPQAKAAGMTANVSMGLPGTASVPRPGSIGAGGSSATASKDTANITRPGQNLYANPSSAMRSVIRPTH